MGPVEVGPAFVPFQLSDEMYANIYREPLAYGYPVLPAGEVENPKFGYIYVEEREAGSRRPKSKDGLGWVPAGTTSGRLLQDGQTEIVRHYFARRIKSDLARPQVKPYVVYLRTMFEGVRRDNPGMSTNQAQAQIGHQWRALPESEKASFKAEAARLNRQLRARMSSVDPQQLLVRHEMWLQGDHGNPLPVDAQDGEPQRILVHYLGDDAFQCLSMPPRPVMVNDAVQSSIGDGPAGRVNSSDQTADIAIVLQCRVLSSPHPHRAASRERPPQQLDDYEDGSNSPESSRSVKHRASRSPAAHHLLRGAAQSAQVVRAFPVGGNPRSTPLLANAVPGSDGSSSQSGSPLLVRQESASMVEGYLNRKERQQGWGAIAPPAQPRSAIENDAVCSLHTASSLLAQHRGYNPGSGLPSAFQPGRRRSSASSTLSTVHDGCSLLREDFGDQDDFNSSPVLLREEFNSDDCTNDLFDQTSRDDQAPESDQADMCETRSSSDASEGGRDSRKPFNLDELMSWDGSSLDDLTAAMSSSTTSATASGPPSGSPSEASGSRTTSRRGSSRISEASGSRRGSTLGSSTLHQTGFVKIEQPAGSGDGVKLEPPIFSAPSGWSQKTADVASDSFITTSAVAASRVLRSVGEESAGQHPDEPQMF